MLRSLYSGVSGLTSHQTKMDVIGNNIANVNTYGYKTKRVTFRDIYYQTMKGASAGSDNEGGVNPSQIGYGVNVASVDKIMSRSSFQSTGRTLDVSIAGEGFIQVEDKSGNKFYTRAGNLAYDNEGNLVDALGKFVLGTQNENPRIAEGLLPDPGNGRIKINVPDQNIAQLTLDPIAANGLNGLGDLTGDVIVKAGFFNGDQPKNVQLTINHSADPSGVTAYDPSAAPVELEINISDNDLAKIKTPEQLQNKINSLIDNEIKQPSKNIDGDPFAPGATPLMSQETFKAGKLTISIDTKNVTGPNGAPLTAEQASKLQAELIDPIMTGITGGEMETFPEPQTPADLTALTIGANGTIIGNHPIHGVLTFGRIDLATFVNPEGLDEAGNSYFAETAASGTAQLAAPGFDGSGELVSSSLEMSNVNLAQEFSDMITTQRGFQANSRIITTSDTMLEELINLKR